jgi:hypothetical protein
MFLEKPPKTFIVLFVHPPVLTHFAILHEVLKHYLKILEKTSYHLIVNAGKPVTATSRKHS